MSETTTPKYSTVERITKEGKDLLTNFQRLQLLCMTRRAELIQSEKDLLEAKELLAKFLLPADACFDEKIGIWLRDAAEQEWCCIACKRMGPGMRLEYDISFRPRILTPPQVV